MPLDPLYLSAGLGALCMLLAAVAAVMQRRLSRQQAELSLLDERLSQAMLAQEGLGAQLETSRLEHAELQASRAALQAEAAVLRRETEWLQTQRLETRELLDDLQAERDAQQAELRALSASHAAVSAELNEQQKTHEQRLEDLQRARDELRAQFAESPPDTQSLWWLGPGMGQELAPFSSLFAYLPEADRPALLQVLRELDPDARADLSLLAPRLNEAQRQALRRELIAAAPAERAALIRARL